MTYQSNVPKVKYVLTELEKGALKEIGKFVVGKARDILISNVTERTGKLRKAMAYSVRRKEKCVRIGVRRRSFYGLFIEKGHKIVARGHYFNERSGKEVEVRRKPSKSASMEFGGRTVAARPFLTPAAENNITQIRLIAGKYFKKIEDENIERGIADTQEIDEIVEAE